MERRACDACEAVSRSAVGNAADQGFPLFVTRRSAGVVLLRKLEERWYCLLLRAYRNWDFPKGRVEPGEEPLAAAVREVEEETGLVRLEFRWGQVSLETEPYAAGKVSRFYVAAAPFGDVYLPVNPALGHPEHHEYRWVRLDQAGAMLQPRLQRILSWVRALVENAPDRA